MITYEEALTWWEMLGGETQNLQLKEGGKIDPLTALKKKQQVKSKVFVIFDKHKHIFLKTWFFKAIFKPFLKMMIIIRS